MSRYRRTNPVSFIGPIITCICLLSATGAPAMGAENDFAVWLDELRTEAIPPEFRQKPWRRRWRIWQRRCRR
jgi:hypothetical protein